MQSLERKIITKEEDEQITTFIFILFLLAGLEGDGECETFETLIVTQLEVDSSP